MCKTGEGRCRDCYSGCVFDADWRANPLTSLKSEGVKVRRRLTAKPINPDPDDACELFGVVGLGSSVDGCFAGSDDAADLLRLVVLESGLHEYAAEFDLSGDETFIGPV